MVRADDSENEGKLGEASAERDQRIRRGNVWSARGGLLVGFSVGIVLGQMSVAEVTGDVMGYSTLLFFLGVWVWQHGQDMVTCDLQRDIRFPRLAPRQFTLGWLVWATWILAVWVFLIFLVVDVKGPDRVDWFLLIGLTGVFLARVLWNLHTWWHHGWPPGTRKTGEGERPNVAAGAEPQPEGEQSGPAVDQGGQGEPQEDGKIGPSLGKRS